MKLITKMAKETMDFDDVSRDEFLSIVDEIRAVLNAKSLEGIEYDEEDIKDVAEEFNIEFDEAKDFIEFLVDIYNPNSILRRQLDACVTVVEANYDDVRKFLN